MSVHSTTALANGHTITIVENWDGSRPTFAVQERDETGKFLIERQCGPNLALAVLRRSVAATALEAR